MKKIILLSAAFLGSFALMAEEKNLTGYNYFNPNNLYYQSYYPKNFFKPFSSTKNMENTVSSANYEIYDSNINYVNQLPAPAYGVEQLYKPQNSFDYYNYYQKTYTPENKSVYSE